MQLSYGAVSAFLTATAAAEKRVESESVKKTGADKARPLIVCGMGRSGTRMCANILSNSSQVELQGEVGGPAGRNLHFGAVGVGGRGDRAARGLEIAVKIIERDQSDLDRRRRAARTPVRRRRAAGQDQRAAKHPHQISHHRPALDSLGPAGAMPASPCHPPKRFSRRDRTIAPLYASWVTERRNGMNQARLDKAREGVLDQMEAGRRTMNLGYAAAALLELALLVACALLIDWSNGTQVMLLVIFILSYAMLSMGLVILAGHVTRSTGRILAVLEAQRDERR